MDSQCDEVTENTVLDMHNPQVEQEGCEHVLTLIHAETAFNSVSFPPPALCLSRLFVMDPLH